MKRLVLSTLVFLALFSLAPASYADPTKDKTPAQEVAEKFVELLLAQDFKEAARLGASSVEPSALESDAKELKDSYDKASKTWQEESYRKDFNGVLQKRELAPQTLVSFRRGGNDNESRVLVVFTEKHTVQVPGVSKPWQFFWHHEVLITVNKDNKITNVEGVAGSIELLMRLRPEDCVAPAVC